jgi:hypothetical protein
VIYGINPSWIKKTSILTHYLSIPPSDASGITRNYNKSSISDNCRSFETGIIVDWTGGF